MRIDKEGNTKWSPQSLGTRKIPTVLTSVKKLATDPNVIFLILGLTHIGFAISLKKLAGIDIEIDPKRNTWEFFYQVLPSDLLQTKFLESIWNLHSQPPLFNVYGAILMKLQPDGFLQLLHYTNILLGGLITGFVYRMTLVTTHNNRISILSALAIAFYPTLILYEAYILYTLFVTFLISTSVFFLSRFEESNQKLFLLAMVFSINLVILTRSIFHLFILIPILILVTILKKHHWKILLLSAFAISLLAIVWYGKNSAKFDFFGASSWYGLNLWRIAYRGYSDTELRDLVNQDIIDEWVVETEVFRPPSDYAIYGFDKSSEIEALNRDDYNNINYIDISRGYYRNAVNLIKYSPKRYLNNVATAYTRFTSPSSRNDHLFLNAESIRTFEAIVSQGIQGQFFMEIAGLNTFYSFFTFLIPLSVFVYIVLFLNAFRVRKKSFTNAIRNDPTMVMILLIIIYMTFASILFELGENTRFKFLIEPVFWVFVVTITYRLLGRISRALQFKQRSGSLLRSR